MPDFIVVGGGSAGAVVANRLSADPTVEVLLLEAGVGRPPRESLVPAAFPRLFKSVHDWNYATEPEPALAGRALYWPRGRLLGGSSAMNAMIWTRGARADFDGWSALSNRGWSYSEIEPCFDRIELPSEVPPSPVRQGITVSPLRTPNELSRRFVAALGDAGIPANDGFRGGVMDGGGFFRVTQAGGARISSAAGFLDPVRARSNLTVVPNARATRIELDGHRAVGVRYRSAGAERVARGRVVLSAGAIGSPHLLMLSGIGPAAALDAAGVRPRIELEGVGAGLQDHLAIGLMHRSTRPVTMAGAERPDRVLRYLVRRTGPLSSNVAEAGAFLRLRNGPVPDLELIFAPSYFVEHGLANPPGHGYTIAVILQHPTSRGTITLQSPDPDRPPAIRANYLSDRAELELLVDGLALARRIAAHAAFDRCRGPETLPGPDEPLERFVRARAETLYHPVGTCRMGSDPGSVVTDGLRVHGVDDLWVADASVMPSITTGHPNAAVMAIGDRAAELIVA